MWMLSSRLKKIWRSVLVKIKQDFQSAYWIICVGCLFYLTIYIYCYILSRLFLVTFHEFLAHPTNYFILQCTDYFLHPFGIIFFVLSLNYFWLPSTNYFWLCQLNFWFHDALCDLDLYAYKRDNTGGISGNSNCTNSLKWHSRNRPNSTNSPHKWAILQQC